MRKREKLLLAAVLLLSGRAAAAQNLTTTGTPAAMTITTAIAGSDPASVSENSTTYKVTAVGATTNHITAALNANTPTGVTLTVSLAVTVGATSSGPVALDVTARNVVTNITVNQISNSITYKLSALASAGVIASQSRTVTFTLVSGP